MEYVRNNPNKPWDLFYLSFNKQLTVKDVETLKLRNSKKHWNWGCISKYIDIHEVRDNPDKPWNKYCLSRNKGITIKDIETLKLPHNINNWDWDWEHISFAINVIEVRNNPNKPWYKTGLSHNKQLTVKDIDTLILPNSKGDWCWHNISQSIDIQEIINNPNKPWDRGNLNFNEGITEKILEFFDAGLLKHLQKNIYVFKYHTDIVVKCEY